MNNIIGTIPIKPVYQINPNKTQDNIFMKTLIPFGLILILVNLSFAATDNNPLRPMHTNNPPTIDGVLDDVVWQSAPTVTGFKTFIPDFGLDMVEKTVVYMAYDRENLYFAYQCFDSQPDQIKSSITARDNVRPDDWICLNLDSFNDQQSLYAFYVNPAGIQGDARYAAGREDHSVDLVWYSAGKINDDGYIIEMQIPLKSIRYSDKNPVEMSVFFERRISRRSEQGSFPPLDPARGYAFLPQMKPMFYKDLKHYKLVEILPAVTYSHRDAIEEGKLTSDERQTDIGLTLKYGITSQLILDGTINPDFSQVEADAGQVDVNLRYDLYFPETRPFFQEGSEFFNFAGTGHHNPIGALVHTRTIVDPVVGLKLSGKVGKKSTLASIYAVDEFLDEDAGEMGERAHFAILRFKRALNEDSYIGAILTDREWQDAYNRLVGADGQIRLSRSSMLGFHGVYSQTKEGEARDTQGTHSAVVQYDYSTRNLNLGLWTQDLAEDFQARAGYVRRTGITQLGFDMTPKIYPDSEILRRIDFHLLTENTHDKHYDMWDTYNFLNVRFVMTRATNLSIRGNLSNEVFLGERFKTSGWNIGGRSQITKELFLRLNYGWRRKIYYDDPPFQGTGQDASATMIFQPSTKIRTELSARYSDFYDADTSDKIFDYMLARCRLTYQFNKYLFFRGVVEYNDYYKTVLTDFLASFTYIPGTVMHVGYGSFHEKIRWDAPDYRPSDTYLQTARGLFFKMSYLWRM